MKIRLGTSKSKGIVCILLSAMSFALMNVFVRLAGDIPSMQKAFFRNLVALVVAGVMVKNQRQSYRCNRTDWVLLIARAVVGTLSILGNFYAVEHLILADANILVKLAPFFAIVFSLILLKEKVTVWQAVAVVAAFVGSLFIVKPSGDNLVLVPALVGLGSGIASGMAYTLVRMMGNRGIPKGHIVLCFSAVSCLSLLPYVLVVRAPMSPYQWGMLLLAGAAACGGQFGMTAAYSYAPARDISVFDFSQVLFSGILGFFIFQELPDGWSLLGYTMILVTAVFMATGRAGKKNHT